MQNIFDFDGCPLLRDGPDLRDVGKLEFLKFVAHLADADVVCCVSPDDSFVVLPPGEQVMRDAEDKARLRYLIVQVANDTQADMLVGARAALAGGGMRTRAGITAFRDLLISVQDVADGVH